MTTLRDIERDDPHFERDVLASDSTVEAVAAFYRRNGWRAHVPETKVRPDIAQMRDYSDGGDLWVERPVEIALRPVERHRVEVTRVGGVEDVDDYGKFRSVEDYARRFETMLLDPVHKIDKAVREGKFPWLWWKVNHWEDFALLVPGDSWLDWEVKTKLDRKKNRERTNYYAPLSCCVGQWFDRPLAWTG